MLAQELLNILKSLSTSDLDTLEVRYERRFKSSDEITNVVVSHDFSINKKAVILMEGYSKD